MGEVLSQDEIDNLLKALSTGELDADEMKNTDERQVKDYDFARPAKRNTAYEQAPAVMRTDVKEKEDSYELEIDLPGYKKENVKAQLKDGRKLLFIQNFPMHCPIQFCLV